MSLYVPLRKRTHFGTAGRAAEVPAGVRGRRSSMMRQRPVPMLAIACRAWKELNHPAPTNRPAVGIWYDFHCRRPRGFFIFGRIRLLAARRDAEKEILVLSEICSDMSKAPKDGKILGHFQKAPPVEEIWWDQEKDGGQGA